MPAARTTSAALALEIARAAAQSAWEALLATEPGTPARRKANAAYRAANQARTAAKKAL